jgi:hypothetical protein
MDVDIKSQAKVDYSHVFLQKFLDPWLTVNIDASFPALQRHRLQKSKQTNAVVSVHVADENLHLSIHTKAGLDEISLHPFASIKEQQLTLSHDSNGGQSTFRSGGC